MTDRTLYKHTPGIVLRPGVVCYTTDARNEYVVYKIIAVEDSGELLAGCYWPSDVLPTPSNWQAFDLRTACETVSEEVLEQVVFLAEEPVSNHELEELATYRRISEGKRNRALQLELLLEKAAGCVTAKEYPQAIAIYTECTSFARYHFTVFFQRGYCLVHTGNDAEAMADLEHALTIDPSHTGAMYWYAKACVNRHMHDKAIEKLAHILTLQPSYTEASELLTQISNRG